MFHIIYYFLYNKNYILKLFLYHLYKLPNCKTDKQHIRNYIQEVLYYFQSPIYMSYFSTTMSIFYISQINCFSNLK